MVDATTLDHGKKLRDTRVQRRDRDPAGPIVRSRYQRPMQSSEIRGTAGDAPAGEPGRFEVHVPIVRPFRALRYAPDVAGDIGRLVAPPYDVIGEEERRVLLARNPRNVVRLDFPTLEPGDPDSDERYRRASRLLSGWRGEGAIRQDPRPAVYLYEQEFRAPGSQVPLLRRGFFARVGLEPFGSGIRAHERTLPGPREDRYRLLRATNVNTSPVVAMYEDDSGHVAEIIEAVAGECPSTEAVDIVGDRHRLWMLTVDTDGRAERLAAAAATVPLTIADGHHRYETALRYRVEQRVGNPEVESSERGSDFVLMLLLEPGAGPLLVLPTHRVVHRLGQPGLSELRTGLRELFEVHDGVTRTAMLDTFGPEAASPGGTGRIGLWTRDGGSILVVRRPAIEPLLPEGGAALRGLDVSVLGSALAATVGLDAAAVASGDRLTYTKDAAEAMSIVDAGGDAADVAFLLDPTPASEIIAVASQGDVMPQKSTYIYPKAITGLVINPLEG